MPRKSPLTATSLAQHALRYGARPQRKCSRWEGTKDISLPHESITISVSASPPQDGGERSGNWTESKRVSVGGGGSGAPSAA